VTQAARFEKGNMGKRADTLYCHTPTRRGLCLPVPHWYTFMCVKRGAAFSAASRRIQ